ncbi:unnamed protein product [Larinioides sclopetarius]|uniref:SHSP domain-containing protein n=1 Tax=Larinioides sclopetarius TaxID=280406 RepID=A0AAV1ZMY3_9ARAC
MPRKIDLSPFFLGRDWWDDNKRPKRILNQKFATVLSDEDLSNADMHVYKGFKSRPRMPASVKASGSSVVNIDRDWFLVSLDLDEFELGELSVITFGRFVEVHGKQVDKMDKYGLVSREFRRQYMVPSNCDIDALTSSLSSDYKLTIKAPVNREEHVDRLMEVPMVEIEDGVPPMEVDQEEYREIVQKSLRNFGMYLETNEEEGLGKLRMNQGTKKSLKLMEDMVRETRNRFRVPAAEPGAAKLPSEQCTIEAKPSIQPAMGKMVC